MSPLSIFLFTLLLLSVVPTHCRRRHVITIPTSGDIHPSSLLWDPSSQHFLLPSLRHVITISDASVLETLTLALDSPISSIAIDPANNRLLVSTAAAISSFDLRRPHDLLSTTPISIPIASMAVDPTTSTTFLASNDQILTVDRAGTVASLSNSQILQNLTAIAFSSRGFILAVSLLGKIFKIDGQDGATKEVLIPTALTDAGSVAIRSDGSVIIAGGKWARWVKSDDAWAGAGVYDKLEVEEGARIWGAAVRDGRKEYLLVGPAEKTVDGPADGWRIEEVEWPSDEEGDMLWGFVLLALALAYFLYWRFQMGKLVTSVNKKRA